MKTFNLQNCLLLLILCWSTLQSQDKTTRQQILDHGQQIREAFAAGAIDQIRQLHHPEVTKALAYNNLAIGRDAVMKGINETLANYQLMFVENTVEDIYIAGDIALEQTKFAIKGTPKKNGDPFVFRGRTLVTYIRYKESPSGWATLKEIIQPATD
ncbi:MAG: nuclear transport factor 2 family protein [Bacteroidota bacterium]